MIQSTIIFFYKLYTTKTKMELISVSLTVSQTQVYTARPTKFWVGAMCSGFVHAAVGTPREGRPG